MVVIFYIQYLPFVVGKCHKYRSTPSIHVRRMHPRSRCSIHGNLVFDMHLTKLKLHEDAANGVHEGETPRELEKT